MRFYIDGYNLTHKISDENIKEMRVELLETLVLQLAVLK